MSYNKEEFPRFAKTAGKISILAAVVGFGAFMFALMIDVGNQEFQRVSAQNTATTSLTVLNTPPQFVQNAFEITESSTTTPTNSGDIVQWSAIGSDSNGAPYFLLVCSTNATPTANPAADNLSLGTAPPECNGAAIQWGVSTSTLSNSPAFVSTTTVEFADNAATQFNEVNSWYAWVCDDDPDQPACNTTPVQGISATNSSPFHMNQRPVLSSFSNDGGADPGAVLEFSTVSTDPDTVDAEDTLTLIVCQLDTDYDPATDSCVDQLATSTFNPTANATSSYTIPPIAQDASYQAWGFLIDEHGHEASAPIRQDFDVNNVAPTVVGGDIDLNGGIDMSLVNSSAGETTGFTLDFILSDANSCINTSGATSSEFTGFELSVYRSSAACDPSSGIYNPNNCYVNNVATTTWNLSCTASTTSCTGINDDTQIYNCEFPLWFLTDPTDAGPNTPASFANDNWVAEVRGVDDQFATGTSATNTAQVVEVISSSYIALQTAEIPYGALAPNTNTPLLGPTSTIVLNIGNTGLDQEVLGESMCPTFSVATECAVSASSTIPESEQQFASTSIAYNSPIAKTLSSSTPIEADIDVLKTTSTSTPNPGETFWGIAVPNSITVAGSYEGLNTFFAVTASSTAWE